MFACSTGDLIDKLSLDYFAILLELPHRIKLNAICMEPPSDLSDHILNVHLKDNPDAQQLFRHLSVNLNEQLGPLIRPLGPLSARLLEFKSFLLQDVRLSLAVIDYFRSYYGQFHPRLAVKLLLTAYQLRNRPHEHLLRLKLLEEAQQIATKIVPSLQDLRHQPTNRARQLNKLKETFLGQIECELFAAKSQMQSDRLQMQSGPNGRSSRSIVASTLRNAARSHSSMPASLTIRASRPVSLIRHLQPGGLSSRLMVASRWTTAIYY